MMKNITYLFILLSLAACVEKQNLTPEQRAQRIAIFQQYVHNQPAPYQAKAYAMPIPQSTQTTQTNCTQFVANQVNCISTTSH